MTSIPFESSWTSKIMLSKTPFILPNFAGPPGLEPGRSLLESDSLPLAYGPKVEL